MFKRLIEESLSNSPSFGPAETAPGASLEPSWEPGVIEVEFQQDVRPSTLATQAGAT